jgi:hypothetical protein
VAGRGAVDEGDPGHELRTDRDDERWIEVDRADDRWRTIRSVERRPRPPGEQVDDAAADIPDVGRSLAEVLVVDRGQGVRLRVRDAVDGLLGRCALVDRRDGRLDNARVAREQRLGAEDRADILAGPRRRFRREGSQLGGGGGEGGLET